MFYIQITLLEDGDINENYLLEKIFHLAHSKFTELQDANGKIPIGVAFPNYNTKKPSLGNILRLVANHREDLENFNIGKTLRVLSDYIHFTQVRPVPTKISSYYQFQRFQPKANIEVLARRRAKRLGVSFDEAIQLYSKYNQERSKLPFVKIKSSSTNRVFPLFIKRIGGAESDKFEFNTYGLSTNSFLPDF